jgi:hypothetical protein
VFWRSTKIGILFAAIQSPRETFVNQSKRLQKHLGDYMAHELGIAEIHSFPDTAKTSDSLEHKLYKVGSLIFAYGREQRAFVLSPFDDSDRPEVAYTVPEILERAKFKQLLATAEEEVRRRCGLVQNSAF